MKVFVTKNVILSAILIFILPACEKENIGNNRDCNIYLATYSRHDSRTSNTFFLFNESILTQPLPEASGIVSGRKNPGMVYIHEDSGNRPVVYVYDTLGNYRGDIILMDIQNRDWEDIAIGPGPEEGQSYIYVGDIGDNKSVRDHLKIHRFPEPDLSSFSSETAFSLDIEDVFTLSYRYAEGASDAETLMVDPATKNLVVVTKRDVGVHVYLLPYPHSNNGIAKAVFKGHLPLRTIVGGGISPDGSQILLKDYGAIYHWMVQDDVISTLFNQTPVKVAYVPEVQGEAVGWTHDGKGYFTTTETEKHEADPVLYHYRRK